MRHRVQVAEPTAPVNRLKVQYLDKTYEVDLPVNATKEQANALFDEMLFEIPKEMRPKFVSAKDLEALRLVSAIARRKALVEEILSYPIADVKAALGGVRRRSIDRLAGLGLDVLERVAMALRPDPTPTGPYPTDD